MGPTPRRNRLVAASPAKRTPPSLGSSSARWPAVWPGACTAVAAERQDLAVAHVVLDGDGLAGARRGPAAHDAHDQRPQQAGARLERPAAHALAQSRGVLGLHPDLGAGVRLDRGEPADVVAVQVRDDDAAKLLRRAAQRPQATPDALRAGLDAGVDQPQPAVVVLHEEHVHAAESELVHAARDLLRHRRSHRRSLPPAPCARLKYATALADLVVPPRSERHAGCVPRAGNTDKRLEKAHRPPGTAGRSQTPASRPIRAS